MAAMACASSLTFPSTQTQKSIFGTQLKQTPVFRFPGLTKTTAIVSPQASSKSCTEQWRQLKKEVKKELAIPHVPLAERWMFTLDEAAGPDIWNKTWYPKAADHVPTDKTWYVVDATDLILGRLASIIAVHIRGKNVASFTPSVDMGAFVIVVNADKIAVSGKKRTQKLYRRHSGRPGGLKEETFDQLQKRIPERIVEHAVRGMLPKGRLGRYLFNHLKVYKGPDHPHQAQQPIDLPLRDKRIRVSK
ncbi:50S ribosomal protein L13, chloroplastic-like [Chenopodium quinoa]|uniref:Large ribosomal subunit protein uL13c n=1 Tax=Chenopodium quinoa TaxID=63459 RepID=A0A803N2V1_CHEQI|nr:50S ribosomal protein L13, chloroplastic-like [Chenopodium quinoa]